MSVIYSQNLHMHIGMIGTDPPKFAACDTMGNRIELRLPPELLTHMICAMREDMVQRTGLWVKIEIEEVDK